MDATRVLTLAALLALAATAAADELPRLDPDKLIACHTDAAGQAWRVQCIEPGDGQPGRCLEAPDGELDARGRISGELERARRCSPYVFDRAAHVARGVVFVRAAPDAPRGWRRDERGRIFQVTFDLHRRLYAGVAWAPTLRPPGGGEPTLDRLAFDLALLELAIETGDAQAGFRHRLTVLDGTMRLAPFGADLTLARYDLSRRRSKPLFRLSTFFGTPRRYDVDAHVGAWVELGHVTTGEDAGGDWVLWRYGTGHLTWDLWRSAAMDSFVRLRGGVGAEKLHQAQRRDRDAITPSAALEADLVTDQAGLGRLTALFLVERPRYLDPEPDRDPSARRALGRLGYERVVVAVNDQPITARLGLEAEYRDDLEDAAPGWDLRALAGLRFSLWAPAR